MLDASRKKDYDDKKFAASIQGVDLEESVKEIEDVSVLNSQNAASREGFGPGEGLGFMTQE